MSVIARAWPIISQTGEGPVLGRRIEIAGLHADGHWLLVELAITAFHIAGAPVFTAYLRDITERVRAERRRNAQYAVASLLAASRSIEEVAPPVIETIAQSGNWIYGALWLLDAERRDHPLSCPLAHLSARLWKSLPRSRAP